MSVTLTDLKIHDGPGRYRAVAVDGHGRPWRLFQELWNGKRVPLRLGDVESALVRRFDASQGGAFLEIEASGEEVFLRARERGDLNDGARHQVCCVAEARRDKLARVELSSREGDGRSAFERWKASLPGGATLIEETDPDCVLAAFEEALSPVSVLSNGGQIFLEQTRALTAIDIDSHGRSGKGSAGARALSLNLEAVTASARQLALRDLGGAIVIDCVDPINAEAGKRVHEAFRDAFQAVSTRRIQVLKPSRFGLMEASLTWGATPIQDRLLDETGTPTPETQFLNSLAEAARHMRSDRTGFYELRLSAACHHVYRQRYETVDAMLKERFSARLSLGEPHQYEDNRIERI